MKKIIINKTPWQTRIAILDNQELQNIYFAPHQGTQLERSFFKGIITKVIAGTQSAFVDIGQEKSGFLHISEVDHELAIQKISATTQIDDDEPVKDEEPVKKISKRTHHSPDIKDIFKEGDPVLVQVSKEPIYEKGPKLTTCFTLPGRFIVLMPNIPRIGISKKIESREERIRLKEIVRGHLPEGMGAIIRTTSEEQSSKNLIKDIDFLVETWKQIQKKFKAAQSVEKIHEDLDLEFQVVRDSLDDDVESIIVDDKEAQRRMYKFVKDIAPEHSQNIHIYTDQANIFDYYNISAQIEAALKKQVNLKSGGSLIIESTEAMTVIDVNTGRFTGKKSLEDTIFKTNLEAAGEVVRQLRLRNIGGLIVIDFIDMSSSSNRNKLFNTLGKTLKEKDKFQSVVLKVSEFGLVEMTRKRSGKTLVQELTNTCRACHGLGFIKSLQTDCYAIFKELKTAIAQGKDYKKILLGVSSAMFDYITSTEYDAILQLEKMCSCKIEVVRMADFATGQYTIEKK
ncbi:MAG TPA: Rne/Rng family ribonuclease [Candidatus Babeliales bacterium]|nr:Rne/Rng family ribonuclease [Candidatus Babeliales bacterium]